MAKTHNNIEPKVSPEELVEMLQFFKDTKDAIESNVQFDMMQFASGYAKGYGTFTPDMSNTAMKNINLNPLLATVENINTALASAKTSEDLLVSYGQDMYLRNMLYKRNLDYMNGLPAWNLALQCINANPEDYKSSSFKKDLKKVKGFLSKFDYRTEFDKAFFNMLNAERYPCIFRTDMCDTKYVLQDFPYTHTKITGRSTWGFLYDIDMAYFLQPSIDIELFPSWIKKKYNALFKNKSTTSYFPSNELNNRTGSFAMWTQTSQEDGAWCFKFKNELVANIPYFSPMLADLVLIPVFRTLQLSQSTSAARKIIASSWPLLKEQKSGNVSDMLAVKPETMGKLMGTFAKGLEDAFKIINLPSDEMQQFEFENTDKDAYSSFLKVTASLLGGGNVLFNTTKNTVAETNLSVNIDEILATGIYPQFESFLDYYINQITKNFKFKTTLSGTKTYLNREFTQKQAFDAAAIGVVSVNKIANAMGQNMFELIDDLEMTSGLGFTDKLMTMISLYNQTKDSSGRPAKSENELTDSGQETRGSGSNIPKGGRI